MVRVAVTVLVLATCACAGVTRRDIQNAAPLKNIERLQSDRSWVREEAALALGNARVIDAAPSLEALVVATDNRDYVRAAAAYALGRIGAARSFAVLAGVATERGAPPALQLAVIEAVCRYQPADQAAPQALAPLVNNADLLVSTSAQREVSAGCVH